MLLILFFILFLLIYCILNERDLEKYKKFNEKRFDALNRRMKSFKHNQDITFDYLNDIYNDLEGGIHEK